MVSRTHPQTRAYLRRHEAILTQQAGGDLRALCLSPRWLLRSAATRPVGEIVADLLLSDDPELIRLARTLQQSAHLLRDSRSPLHRVNTVIAWMSADPRLQQVADRCLSEFRRVHLRLLWAVRPTGTARGYTLRRHVDRVSGCHFSTDDRYLTTLDQRGTVLLWDVESGAYVATLDAHQVHGGRGIERWPRVRMMMGPERTWVISGSADRVAVLTSDGVLAVWSLADDVAPIYALDTATDGGNSASFLLDVDADVFISQAADRLRLHSWSSAEVLMNMPLDGDRACWAIDRCGGVLAAETVSRVIDVWDLRARRHAGRIPAGRADISQLVPDAELLFVTDERGKGHLWDWTIGQRIGTYRGFFDVVDVDARAGQLRLLRGPGDLAVLDIRSTGGPDWWQKRVRVPRDHRHYRASPVRIDAQLLAIVTRVEEGSGSLLIYHRVDVFDMRDGRSLLNASGPGSSLRTTRGPKPRQLLIVTDQGVAETWDLELGQVKRARTVAHTWGVSAAAVSNDREVVAVSVFDDVQLLRPSEAENDPTYDLSDGPIDVLADPMGRWLATLSDQLNVSIWDPQSGARRSECPHSAELVFRNGMPQRLFSPDGHWIAVNDWDSSVVFWNPMTGHRLGTLDPHPSADVPADIVHAAAGPTGPIVVVRGDGELVVWEVGDRRRLGVLSSMNSVCGDAAGQWLAGRDPQGKVIVFDLARGRVQQLSLSANGIAAEPGGHHLYLWDEHSVSVLRWADRTLEPIATLPTAGGVDRVLVNSHGGQPLVVALDGSLVRLGGGQLSLPSPLAGVPDLRWLLSPTGDVVAAASSNDIELIDLTGPAARASVTVDGRIFGMTWVGDRSVVVAGAFGIQALTLESPSAKT